MDRNRRPPPREALRRLVQARPARLRDRRLDAPGDDRARSLPDPDSLPATVAVDRWTPVRGATGTVADPRTGTGTGKGANAEVETSVGDGNAADFAATIVSEPAIPDETAVSHTLVLRIDDPVASIRIDYGGLDTGASPATEVRVSTVDGEAVDPVAVDIAPDGTLAVALPNPAVESALFVEYEVIRNPPGGQRTVDVFVDRDRHVEANLTLLG